MQLSDFHKKVIINKIDEYKKKKNNTERQN